MTPPAPALAVNAATVSCSAVSDGRHSSSMAQMLSQASAAGSGDASTVPRWMPLENACSVPLTTSTRVSSVRAFSTALVSRRHCSVYIAPL